MSDEALAHVMEEHRVFAKLTPLHKERIVRALRANGHVVGFMGDGINDAPALRAADIGISVDSAVDIAKEAADINHVAKTAERKPGSYPQALAQVCNLEALTPVELQAVLATTAVGDIWGVGRRISAQLIEGASRPRWIWRD